MTFRGIMRISFLIIAFVALATVASAQTGASSTSNLQWDQDAPSLAEAQGYTYKAYPDGLQSNFVLTGVNCAGTASPFICTVPFPAFTPGNHTLHITASNADAESLPSNDLAFRFIVVPAAPRSLRIA